MGAVPKTCGAVWILDSQLWVNPSWIGGMKGPKRLIELEIHRSHAVAPPWGAGALTQANADRLSHTLPQLQRGASLKARRDWKEPGPQ